MLISLKIACTLNIITYMKRLSYSKIKYMREWRKKQLRINPVKYKLQAIQVTKSQATELYTVQLDKLDKLQASACQRSEW